MNEYQLAHLRKATSDLINSEPTLVALTKAGYERVAGGGIRKNPGAPEAPVARFFGSADEARRVVTPQGEMVMASFVLLGTYDDTIEEGDTFPIGSTWYRVAFVDPVTREFECKGWVVLRG